MMIFVLSFKEIGQKNDFTGCALKNLNFLFFMFL